MVAPCSISTACFSLGVFTCTVIFPLPWLERALEQATQNCQVGQHVVSNHNQKHLCSLRHGDAGSAGRLAALCKEINHLSNLQKTHVQLAPTLCCPISALINPEAAAANAASRLSTFWNLLGSRNLYALHVIIGNGEIRLHTSSNFKLLKRREEKRFFNLFAGFEKLCPGFHQPCDKICETKFFDRFFYPTGEVFG